MIINVPIIAYIANEFPSAVEPYVMDEIRELRCRGVNVVSCSAKRAAKGLDNDLKEFGAEILFLQPLQKKVLLQSLWLCLRRFPALADFIRRALIQGHETFGHRLRALLHTWLGAYYALRLTGRGVQHIHAHHGYFSSWIAMVAARLLGIGFSFTLHGSDLFLHPAWLDLKLKNCDFCFTISEFNRRHILTHYPQISPAKVFVQYLGVDTRVADAYKIARPPRFTLLTVGRLYPVKNHVFLLHACKELTLRNIEISCWIAGEGPQRKALEQLVTNLDLRGSVHLLGHLSRTQLDLCYHNADLVVLTSHSEGIPLTLMEAMARGKPVLAPAITGIPELITDGTTGFLYPAGSMKDFISRIEYIRKTLPELTPLTKAARRRVFEHFDRDKNLCQFADRFLNQIALNHPDQVVEATSHADPILQQI